MRAAGFRFSRVPAHSIAGTRLNPSANRYEQSPLIISIGAFADKTSSVFHSASTTKLVNVYQRLYKPGQLDPAGNAS